ncbi:peptidase family M48-domain-containing protein [Aspergillus karnatakaensis]|uniref:M48 family metallopeptidase n=1 Tax=Aspergillus karnatakaensis TaxID=1810916 RepID=UPI003CCE533D
MFRFPIASTLRAAAQTAAPISRTRVSAIPSQCSARLFSTPCVGTQRTNASLSSIRTSFRSSRSAPLPHFRDVNQRAYSNGFKYRRFDGPKGQTVFFQLVRNAKPYHFVAVGGIIGGFYVYNTDTVEETGRRRFNCVSHKQELYMGEQSYQEVLQEYRGRILPDSHPQAVMVRHVLERLIPQAPIEGADWRVHVIKDDNMTNAFVLPGGKVFVFTGILPISQDEDGLAAVLGHEIAHVTAHHTGERMSTSIVTMGIVFLTALLFDVSGQIPSLILNLMYSLPNSRTQEAEADNIGLMIMSKACFNPEAAVGLWDRMQKAEKQSPPQFLSTHPTNYNRMEAIQGWLDKARTAYEDSGCSSIATYMPGFRQARNDFGW